MGPIVCPETPVRNYHYTLRIDAEERSSFLLRGERLKSTHLSTHMYLQDRQLDSSVLNFRIT
jgi:hypothetical protein